MFHAQSQIEVHNIRHSIERIGKLSDSIVGVGPVGFGLEGLLEFLPGVGEVYSLGAGLMLILQGMRVYAPFTTLFSVAFLILLRTAIGSLDVILAIVPVLGWIVGQLGNVAAGLFRAHRMAANMLIAEIDDTLYVEGRRRDADNADILAAIRSGEERRRVVFLG